MKDQREQVLARVKEALQIPAPKRAPHRHAHAAPGAPAHDDGMPSAASFRSWLPLVGPALQDQIELFSKNSTQLKTEFRPVKTAAEAVAGIHALSQDVGWKKLASHRLKENTLLSEVQTGLSKAAKLPVMFTEAGYDVAELEGADAAITGCDALIAQTGSILVTNYSAGGRGLSVLPPHHVVVASVSQVVPDLTAAIALLRDKYPAKWPSFMTFITGPSRTGDIERILVLGAHGPKRLTVFLVG
jgi:L-lactate dehydrogenase complex protein LldG